MRFSWLVSLLVKVIQTEVGKLYCAKLLAQLTRHTAFVFQSLSILYFSWQLMYLYVISFKVISCYDIRLTVTYSGVLTHMMSRWQK